MLGIADYFWRLIPANPILLRVVYTASKRRRDLLIRSGYLGLLVFLVTFWLLTSSVGTSGSLSEVSKTSAMLFQRMSYLQLGLVALLAPIFTAGAITQEKDSQTYDILLATPLTNGQIVLGSLLSRLFFVVTLLISGIPVFSVTQIFGGVAISSIVESFFIAAATAFVTGALAMAIAVFKVGTRRTIFSFYLFIVIYLVGLLVLDQLPYFQVAGHQVSAQATKVSNISWFTGLHPFLALRSIFHDPTYTPPLLGDLPPNLQAWPMGWYLTDPAGFYITFMFALSFLLVTPSIVLMRRLAQSTTSLKTSLLQLLRISKGDKTRKPRNVWSNPIAWREAKTRASAARASILRYGFMFCGLAAAITVVAMYAAVKPTTGQNFLDTRSYDATNQTLTVYDQSGVATTLSVGPETTITLDNKPTQLDQFRERMDVVATPKIEAGGRKTEWASLAAIRTAHQMDAMGARQLLLGLTVVEFAVILLIVTNAAASTVTREKEDGTLDLLLSTPITSRYYIWGKLRGLVSFVLPLVAIPVVSVAIFVLYDLWHHLYAPPGANIDWIAFPEALVILPPTLIVVAAFASIVGMQLSLRCRKTVVAVMASVGVVVGLCAILGFCGFQLLGSSGAGESGDFGAFIGSFSPFTLLSMEIDPLDYAARAFSAGDTSNRIVVFIGSLIAVAVYAATVLIMYRSMVKNFDMTIRRQQR